MLIYQAFRPAFLQGFLFASASPRKGDKIMKTNQQKVIRTAIMAMLTALSIVSLYVIKFPLIPAAPFLEYDAADIPVLIGSMLLGPVSGIAILLAVCIIQAITVSASSGIIGFFMHFIASSVLVLTASCFYKKKKTTASLILGLVIGSIAMTVVMIPLNLIFTGIFMGAGTQTVIGMLIPAIIPFNLLKAGINSAVTFAVFLPISGILKKFIKGSDK